MNDRGLDRAVVTGAEGIVDASTGDAEPSAVEAIRARAKAEAQAAVEDATRAKALLDAAAQVVQDSARLVRVETQQSVHADQIGALEKTIAVLAEATNKLSSRIAIGLVVIFAGTENGGDLLHSVVQLVMR